MKHRYFYDDIIAKVGEELARQRVNQQLTQDELADKLRCSRKLIRCFEMNEKTPSFLKILQICDTLGISLGGILIKIE